MTAGHVDSTIKTAVVNNTVFDAVLDATAILNWRNDVADKINSNYDEAHADHNASLGLYRKGSINGGMRIAQRGTSFTIATASSAYTVDRVKSINIGSGANATVTQVAVSDLDGASKGLQMVHASLPSAQGKLSHVYTMEASDSYSLAGQQVTFQVRVKAVLAMDRVTLNARYKTTESAISNSSTLIGTSGATSIDSGTETLVTLTVTLPARATLTTTGVIGIEIVASKTTNEASGDGFIITELDWNVGSTALPFQPRGFDEEKKLCKKYYQVLNSADANTAFMLYGTGFCYSTTNASILIRFEEMRARPTVTLAAVGQFALYNSVASPTPVTAFNQSAKSINSIELLVSVASGLTSGNGTQMLSNNNNTSFIAFDSEL